MTGKHHRDNGVSAGSGINKLEFDGDGQSFPESYGEDGPPGDPRARIDENLNRLIENIDIVATNETSAEP